MKVMILSPQNPYPPIDGGKISIFYPLKYMVKYGIEPILTFPYKRMLHEKSINNMQKIGIKVYPFRQDISDSVSKVVRNIFEKEPFKIKKYYSLGYLKYMEEIIYKENPDIIQSQHIHMANYAIKLNRKFNVPIILREHNIEYKLVEQFYNSENNFALKSIAYWQYLKTRRYEVNIWNYFNHVIFISSIDEKIALALNNRLKSSVIQDGVDIKEFSSLNISKEPFSLIFTGGTYKTIQNVKSIVWFIKNVWSNIKRVEPRAKLYITGMNQDILFRKLNDNELKNQGITFLGFVNDIKRTISRCEIYISPTIFGSGVRLKVLNAMALSMPVICTSLDADTIIGAKDHEHLMVADDPAKFENAILQLFNNESLRYKLGNNARKLIEDSFTWDCFIEKLINVYKNVYSI